MYLCCSFAYNPIVVLIGRMDTRRNAAPCIEEEFANVEAPSHGDQVPPLQEYANMEHAPGNPPPLTDENIRTTLLQMAQTIITQAQAYMAQAQDMTALANWEVVLRPHQQVTTMASF